MNADNKYTQFLIKRHSAVMFAYHRNNAKLEYRIKDKFLKSDWREYPRGTPSWDWKQFDYRIKTAPQVMMAYGKSHHTEEEIEQFKEAHSEGKPMEFQYIGQGDDSWYPLNEDIVNWEWTGGRFRVVPSDDTTIAPVKGGEKDELDYERYKKFMRGL